MSEILKNLSPENVFEYFERICSVPRETGNSQGIRSFLLDFAHENNLECYVDDADNVVIYKDASAGYENEDSIALQCHTDMICDKSYELEGRMDFSKDPLNLETMDDYIFSRGTSLGSIDGIAMAMILAVLSDDTLDHGRLEAIFLANKHDDFDGAFRFDVSKISSKRLINLGHNAEGELLTSSSGGCKVHMSFDMETQEYEGNRFNLVVCGLAGGHAGREMDKCRGNANLLIGRFVLYISKEVPLKIGYLKGGLSTRFIPREAKAEIYVEDQYVEKVESLINSFVRIIEKEYMDVEENLTIYGENLGKSKSSVLKEEYSKKVLLVLNDIPDGIIKMSRNGDDLVQTSLNCGILRLNSNSFELFINIRSTVDCEKEYFVDKLCYLTSYLEGECETISDYPAWEYKADSDFRDNAFGIYQRCFERNPKLTGYPAGMECAILAKGIDDLDIIAFGCNVANPDTFKERLFIPSVANCYDLLTEILADC